MAFIESMWWLWLVVTVLSGGIAVVLQLKNMKGIVRTFGSTAQTLAQSGNPEDMVRAASKGLGGVVAGFLPVMLLGLVASVSGLLLIVSLILNMISHANAG